MDNLRLKTPKRDGVCNPVTHVLQVTGVFKRFRWGSKPRLAWVKATFYDSGLNAAGIGFDNLLMLALKSDNTIPIYRLFFAYLF